MPAPKQISSEDLREIAPIYAELKRRELAKQSLLKFAGYTLPKFKPAPHHVLIAQKLEAVARGEIDRLMIFMPPRHGKSELASRRFPAWVLGNYPGRSIIAASYNDELATEFGRDVKGIFEAKSFSNVFDGVKVKPDSRAVDRMALTNGSTYMAAGMSTGITGRGADILIVDDPVKDVEAADSTLIKNKVFRWFTSVAYTRLEADISDDDEQESAWHGAVVLIQTRWSEDDLAGRLLEAQERGGDRWEVLSLPAIAEEDDDLGRAAGEALWPRKYPLNRLERIRAVLPVRDWSAQYQQRPAPDEGVFFLREWFRYHATHPTDKTTRRTPPREEMKIYGASDYAATADGDYTVHCIFGVDGEDNIYLLDWYRKKATSLEWADRFCELVKQWKPVAWAEEKGPITAAVSPFLDKRIRETKAYVFRDGLASIGSKTDRAKEGRAQGIRGRMQMGKVFFPERAEWLPKLEEEVLTFPASKNDDQVDVLTLIGRYLGRMGTGRPVKPREEPKFGIQHVTMDRLWSDHKRSTRRMGALI